MLTLITYSLKTMLYILASLGDSSYCLKESLNDPNILFNIYHLLDQIDLLVLFKQAFSEQCLRALKDLVSRLRHISLCLNFAFGIRLNN